MTRGMKQVGEVTTLQPRKLLKLARRAMKNPMIWLGLLCLAVSFCMFLALLSWADLSFVVPMTAPSYALSTLGARYFLKENVTTERWLGILFICIGVALVSLQ